MKKLNPISRILIAISALMMIAAYYVPLWQILMWAPQYPEGLTMKIWIDNITGDVKIISALNHYIGMKHIEVSMFPEFSYMIYIVGALIGIGLLAALVNRRIGLLIYGVAVIATGVAALVDFYLWGYDYGHNLDPTAPIVVPGMSYQPPLIGTKQLLNFTAFSGPDIGGWIFIVAGALAIAAFVYEVMKKKKKGIVGLGKVIALATTAVLLASCSPKPEPIAFGKDGCHTCKMTLMDQKFGAEIVTKKGKVFKFDDANCMLNYIRTNGIAEQELANILIIDYSTPGELIDARTALYVSSGEVRSPMAGNLAAFGDETSRTLFNEKWQGTLLRWDELTNR